MVYPHQIAKKVKEFLRANITDVNTERKAKGKEWIYSDFPRLDARMPRAGVFVVNEPIQIAGLNGEMNMVCRIQITIVININQRFDINGDGENEHAEEVIDYLATQMAEAIKNNQEWFKGQWDELIHIIPTGINPVRRGELIYRHIDLEAKYEMS